jgi:hypothetical protein
MNSHTQKINNPAGRREIENHPLREQPFLISWNFSQLLSASEDIKRTEV